MYVKFTFCLFVCLFVYFVCFILNTECPTVSISTTGAEAVVIDHSDSTSTTNIPITTTETNSTLPVNDDGAYVDEAFKTTGEIRIIARR